MKIIKKYTLRFPEELQNEIKEYAQKESRSLHAHILCILQEWVNNKKAADLSPNVPAALTQIITKGNNHD